MARKIEYPSADFLRSVLAYDPETGEFRWKHRADATPGWNRNFAGKIAGGIQQTGHRRITINDRGYLAHRIAWIIMTGELPENEVDHEDLDGANNRWINLREATRQQNQQNRRRHKSNKSGFKGVYKNHCGTYCAQIYRLGKKIHVGSFQTGEDAHAAYCTASGRSYGEFARAA